jgi:hypothetical protein
MIWATSSVNSHRRNALDSHPARPHRHGSFQTLTHPKHRTADGGRQRTDNRPMRAPMSTVSSRTAGGSANGGGRQAGSPDASVQSHIPTDLDPEAGRWWPTKSNRGAARHICSDGHVRGNGGPSADPARRLRPVQMTNGYHSVAVDLLRHPAVSISRRLAESAERLSGQLGSDPSSFGSDAARSTQSSASRKIALGADRDVALSAGETNSLPRTLTTRGGKVVYVGSSRREGPTFPPDWSPSSPSTT